MSFSVKMPALGESVTEGTVTRWLKKEGDRVELDEPLLEVSTDKVDTEIPSPAAGTLEKILVAVDATVPVGADLALIADGASTSTPVTPATPAAPVVAEKVSTPPAVQATPAQATSPQATAPQGNGTVVSLSLIHI